MLDHAVQSHADTLEAAPTAATASFRQGGGQVNSGRRYTAADFRLLIARLSNGAEARTRWRGSIAVAIVVPEATAWLQPRAPQAESEHEAPTTEVNAAAEAQDMRDDDQELSADPAYQEAGDDAGQDAADAPSAEGESTGSLSGEPLAQNDARAVEHEPAGSDEMADEVAPDELPSYSADEGPHELAAPVFETAAAEPATDAVEAEAAVQLSEPVIASSDAVVDPELQSAETARTLLDIMAMPTGVQPQERALAGDTLLRLVSRMPAASLIALCDRLCIMDAPPPLLVRRLINHENVAVAGPLLERCPGISDQDLMAMISMGEVVTLRLIARRRQLSPAVTDALIRHGDAGVTIAVVRNPGAALSHEAFNLLAETAKTRTSLQAPLATRPDTPAPIAFELFWTLPPQLRRYVLSRFLTESANLDRILKIAHTLDETNGGEATASPRTADKAQCEELVGLIAQGKTTEAAQKLAALAGISGANAQRIITDSEGEPLTVAMKAIGMSRTQSAAAAETLRDAPAAPLRSNRRIAELQNLFDSLSFTKARVLLTYWDWAVEKSGPYSGKAA
jgi:uncharacterized protein (DUF2336 family)